MKMTVISILYSNLYERRFYGLFMDYPNNSLGFISSRPVVRKSGPAALEVQLLTASKSSESNKISGHHSGDHKTPVIQSDRIHIESS